MMQRPIQTVPPVARVVSLEEAKAHLRVDNSAEDDLITSLVLAAESRLDGWAGLLGRCMISQTWRYTAPCFFAPVMALPYPDVSSVVVRYLDTAGVEQTISGSHYHLIETATVSVIEWNDDFALPSVASRSDSVRIDLVAGFGDDAENVPADIRHAVKLLLGGWYENREETVIGTIVSSLPDSLAAENLIAPYRRSGL